MSLEIEAQLDRPGFSLDVALNAVPGVTALFGPSGAGKTTLARIAAGLERGATARIVVNGTDIATRPPHMRNVGYVFQDARLFPHLSVAQNLTYGAPAWTAPQAMAERLGLSALLDRRPAGLSGGEAARVALGRALLRKPDFLILDEPLAGLDARRKADLMPHLATLRGEGVPILYITHSIDEVAQLADTLILMRGGRVERAGPVADVLGEPSSAALVGPEAAGAMLSGQVAERRDGLVAVATEAGLIWLPDMGAALGEGVRLRLPASDVIVATEPPNGLSAINILAGHVEVVHPGTGPGVMLGLRVGRARLLARVTRRSALGMDLTPGRAVWAVVKATGTARAERAP